MNGRIMTARAGRSPDFIFGGCHRSGTTMLYRILRHHGQIAMTRTGGASRYSRKKGLTDDLHLTPAFAAKLRKRGELPPEAEALLASGEPVAYLDLLGWEHAAVVGETGRPMLGVGRPNASRAFPVYREMWPGIRLVHLIRDGRDLCLSAVDDWGKAGLDEFKSFRKDPVTIAALWWKWHVVLGRESRHLGADVYHEVRFEGLVSSGEEECTALCEFLDLPFDGAMLRYHEGRIRTDPGLDAKAARLPPTAGLREWRTQLREEDLVKIEAVAGDLLSDLGYERGIPEIPVAARAHAEEMKHRFDAERSESRYAVDPLPADW